MLKREIVPPPEHLYPPDEWRIVEAAWTPQYSGRAETVFALANGYVGIRGTLDEGRPSLEAGTYISGFHETWPIVHAEEAYGLARVGQSMVDAPDATVLELFVDDEPLFMPTARVREYARVLDMRAGILQRDLVWSTLSGKHVTVRSSRLVSLEHRHVAVISYEVTTDQPASIAVVSRVVNRADEHVERRAATAAGTEDPRLGRRLSHRVLQPRLAEDADGRTMLGYEVTNSRMTMAVGVQHVVLTPTPHRVTSSVTPDLSEWVLSVETQPGVPAEVVKYVTYQTSRSVAPRDLAARCHRTLDRTLEHGFDAVVEVQRANLDRFWDAADVVVADRNDPVRVQQAVRWNLFQLCQASWRVEGASIPAKGLTGAAYDGHYFWDTEAYVLPFLAYTQPRIARNVLRFRHSMLPKARERAAVLDLRGALFPWRTINGDEASALYQAGTAQYHLNADIAYAIRRYVDVQGDVGFLAEVGAEILVETARMWEDLGFYGDDGCFHLHGVTGPDEYTTVVNDNAFTNLMARLNLNYAVTAVRLLEQESPELYAALRFELTLEPSEIERLGEGRRSDVHPPRRRAWHHPAGRLVPPAGALGPREHAAGEVPAAPPLPPAHHLPASGAQAGRRRHGDVPARQRVHDGAEAAELRLLRPAHDRRLFAVGQHPEHRRLRDRRLPRRLPLLRLRAAHGPGERGRQRVRRRAHRVRGRGLDGARVRLRRRP